MIGDFTCNIVNLLNMFSLSPEHMLIWTCFIDTINKVEVEVISNVHFLFHNG